MEWTHFWRRWRDPSGKKVHWYEDEPDEIAADFGSYLKRLEDLRLGRNLPPGRVQATAFWMIENEGVVGTLSVRHTLNESLKMLGGHIGYDVSCAHRGKGYATDALRQSLEFAGRIGLSEVLITCKDMNTASIRVIERNGGTLIDKVMVPGRTVLTRRYSIKLSPLQTGLEALES